MRFTRRILIAALLLFSSTGLRADDWPTAGGDPQRSGRSRQDLPSDLTLRWTVRSAHPPMPAWPSSDRLTYDRANVPVVAGGLVFFGSSADGKVRALDAATGRERWSFFTEGPVRFAPASWKDRLFVVSDDGHLYCLQASDGRLLWKKRGAPADRRVLGNDRLISHWPARGGPVVADDTVYFAAGIWPSDGIFLYALDADSGRVKWCNDQSGSIYMPQPHGGANAESGVSAQGALVVAGDLLLVPTGRAVPAAFQRSDGAFKYFHLQQNGSKGGASTLTVDSLFINGGLLFDVPTGTMQDTVGTGAIAACGEGLVRSTDKDVAVLKIVEKEKLDRKGAPVRLKTVEKVWSVADAAGGSAVLSAGSSIVSGGSGRISLIDSKERKAVRSATVDGAAVAMAAADGRLYVATDRGVLHCFGSGAEKPIAPAADPRPPAPDENGPAAAAATAILNASGVTEGFAVDLACGDGALSMELARRSKLQIYAVDSDREKVASARRRLEAAGLYGVRVTVLEGDPATFPFPKWFASLVVSGRSLSGGGSVASDAVLRVQRPYGGVSCLGPAEAIRKNVRGPLEGAGVWTHQYADAANTSCSADGLVRGPLTLYWFRDSDFEMPQRHGRGPAPLSLDGRMFIEGLNGIRAADAYSGRTLWDVSLPKILKSFDSDHLMGTAGTGSNLCATADGVYVRTGSRCLRLDPATGRKLGEFEAPTLPGGKAGVWGYLACENGLLFGSLVNEEHLVKWRYQKGDMSEQFTESVLLFAMDALTGRVRWTLPAKHSFRHNAIAIGGGRVFAIDRPLAEMDKLNADPKNPVEHPKGELLALDSATGKVAWKSDKNIFGTLLIAGVKHDALLMSYQSTAFKLPSEKGGELAVVRMSDGAPLWSKAATYKSRPSLVDRTIYAQGGAWDLLTGEEQKFDLKRSYGCGQLACSSHLAVYRSATMGYTDFASSQGTSNYGGIRLGCWINAIPAAGLVLAPDATTGCRCSYLNQAWIALQPKE